MGGEKTGSKRDAQGKCAGACRLSGRDLSDLARTAQRIVAKPGISREDVEDLTQDCMVAFLTKAHEVRDPDRWVRVVASHLLKQHLRQRYRCDFANELVLPSVSHGEDELLRELALNESVKELPAELQEILFLRDCVGLAVDKIAECIGVDRKRVYWLRQRAIRQLRRLLRVGQD